MYIHQFDTRLSSANRTMTLNISCISKVVLHITVRPDAMCAIWFTWSWRHLLHRKWSYHYVIHHLRGGHSFLHMNAATLRHTQCNIESNSIFSKYGDSIHGDSYDVYEVLPWKIIIQMVIWFSLTDWGRDKMGDISQTIFSNTFSWIKTFKWYFIELCFLGWNWQYVIIG